MNSRSDHIRRRPPGSPFNKPEVEPPPPTVYQVNDRVTDDRLGMGTVIAVSGTTHVTVNFGSEIIRMIALPSTKLQRL